MCTDDKHVDSMTTVWKSGMLEGYQSHLTYFMSDISVHTSYYISLGAGYYKTTKFSITGSKANSLRITIQKLNKQINKARRIRLELLSLLFT